MDILGLDVYKLRSNNGPTGLKSCCINHRYIIEDMGGTNAGWYFQIDVSGVTGEADSVCCGQKAAGVGHYQYQQGHMTAAAAYERARARGDVLMSVALTSSDVDAELHNQALRLNNFYWYYIILWQDCGTFANEWLDKARALQQQMHPPPWWFPIVYNPMGPLL